MSEDSTSKKIAKSFQGEARPISAKHPDTPFSLVLGAYPLGLTVVLMIILAIYAFMQ